VRLSFHSPPPHPVTIRMNAIADQRQWRSESRVRVARPQKRERLGF
jgi:hypothetical protein